MVMKGRSLVSLADFSPDEIRQLLDLSHTVKKEKKEGRIQNRFAGKTIALIFEKRSTRTRCAFETAFGEEGGHPVFLSTQDIQLGAKESVEDTARVLGRMFDAIMIQLEKARIPIVHNSTYTFEFGPKELVNMVGLPTSEGNVLVRKLFENTKLKLVDNKNHITDVAELLTQAEYYRKMEKREKARQQSTTKPSF